MLDMTVLDDGFPVIGEMPRWSGTWVCRMRNSIET